MICYLAIALGFFVFVVAWDWKELARVSPYLRRVFLKVYAFLALVWPVSMLLFAYLRIAEIWD